MLLPLMKVKGKRQESSGIANAVLIIFSGLNMIDANVTPYLLYLC